MNDRNRAGPNRLSLFGVMAFLLMVGLVIFITPDATAEVCLDCHDEMAESIQGTTHEHPAVACASCHKGSEHADDPSTDNITVPTKDTEEGQLATCTSCHQPHLEMDQVGFDPHQTAGLACASCHTVHKQSTRLLVDNSGEFCEKCHTGVTRQFARRSAHPVEEDLMACWSCHDFGSNIPDLGHGSSETCLTCHADVGGPFLHEHEAGSSFSPEAGGCISCHAPHGSSNEMLLKQPGSGLCQQCHGTPPRHRTQHDGIGVAFACVDCHSEIHGSNEHSKFLDPMLEVKVGDGPDACFCHMIEN